MRRLHDCRRADGIIYREHILAEGTLYFERWDTLPCLLDRFMDRSQLSGNLHKVHAPLVALIMTYHVGRVQWPRCNRLFAGIWSRK